jgi:hypothetical protein
VTGLVVGSTGYTVGFQIVNQPNYPPYSSTGSTSVDTSSHPATWSYGPGAMTALSAAEDVELTALLYKDGILVDTAIPGTLPFTLNP